MKLAPFAQVLNLHRPQPGRLRPPTPAMRGRTPIPLIIQRYRVLKVMALMLELDIAGLPPKSVQTARLFAKTASAFYGSP